MYRSMAGEVIDTVFSPGCTWVAFTVREAVDEQTLPGPRTMVVSILRCSTFALAAEWRSSEPCRRIHVTWAAQGNRLCCRCKEPFAEVLLSFEA